MRNFFCPLARAKAKLKEKYLSMFSMQAKSRDGIAILKNLSVFPTKKELTTNINSRSNLNESRDLDEEKRQERSFLKTRLQDLVLNFGTKNVQRNG